MIFAKVPTKDLVRASRASKWWRQMLQKEEL
jgi:hypothetical protein